MSDGPELVLQEAMELPIEETVVNTAQESQGDINTDALTAVAIADSAVEDPHKNVDELLTNQAVMEEGHEDAVGHEDVQKEQLEEQKGSEIPQNDAQTKNGDIAVSAVAYVEPSVSARSSRGGGTCFICMSKGVTSNCPHGKKLPDDVVDLKPLHVNVPQDDAHFSDGSATPPATFSKFPSQASNECHMCGVLCESLKALREHMTSHGRHQASLSYWCSHCRRRFDKPDAHARHEREHSTCLKEEVLICSCCDMHFFKQFHLDKHRQSAEHKVRYEAQQTGFSLRQILARDNPDLNTNTALQQAKASKAPKTKAAKAKVKQEPEEDELRCDVCDASFSTQHWLDKHMRSAKHEQRVAEQKKKEAAFSCEPCGYNFSSRSWYQMHLRSEKHKKQVKNYKKDKTEDTKEKPGLKKGKGGRKAMHKCTQCTKSFASAADLDAHELQAHSQKGKKRGRKSEAAVPAKKAKTSTAAGKSAQKFKCSQCSSSFATQKGLTAHEKKVHPDESSFFCQICQGTFHNERSLEKHLRMHRGEESDDEDVSGSDDSSDSDDSEDSDSSSGDSSDSSDDSSDEEESSEELSRRPPPGSAAARFFCEVCSRNCATAVNYSRHLEGAPHARMLKKRASGLVSKQEPESPEPSSDESEPQDDQNPNRPMELNDIIYAKSEPYVDNVVTDEMSPYPTVTHGTNSVTPHKLENNMLHGDLDIGGYSAVDAQGNEFYVPSKTPRSIKKRFKPKSNPNGPVFACYVCNSFTSDCRSAIEEHVAVKHTNIGGVFPCHTCHLRFDLESQLNQHQAIHTGENMFHCPICRIEFSNFKIMRQHMLEEGHEATETLFLTEKGRQKQPVEQYAGRYAIEEDGTYSCLECNHKFSQKKYWVQHVNSRQHKETMTGIEGTKLDPEAYAGRYRVGADGVFTCIECDLECSHRKYWVLHVGGKKHIQILAGVQIVNPKRPVKKPKAAPSYESFLLSEADPNDAYGIEIGTTDDRGHSSFTVDDHGNIIEATPLGQPALLKKPKPSHYYCAQCDRAFTSVAAFKLHLESVQHEQQITTDPVGQQVLTEKKKKKKKEKRKGPFECKICTVKPFKTFKGLRNHCYNNKEHQRQKAILSRYSATVYDGMEEYEHAAGLGEEGTSSSEGESDTDSDDSSGDSESESEVSTSEEESMGARARAAAGGDAYGTLEHHDLVKKKHSESSDDGGHVSFLPASSTAFIDGPSVYVPSGTRAPQLHGNVFHATEAEEFVAEEVEIG